MEIAMSDVADLYFSGYNSVAAADVSWDNWSPVIGWPPVPVDDDDIHNLKKTMVWQYSDENTLAGSSPETHDHWSSSTISETTFSSPAATPAEEVLNSSAGGEYDKKVRLIHLLSAAAEALSGDQTSHELSRVILARLKDLLPSSSASVSGTERLAAHFTNALQRLLVQNNAGDNNSELCTAAGVTTASQLFQDMSPYVNFGHFTANQAIIEAIGRERRVHIVDFEMMEGAQWAPLMQALMSMKEGPPPSHLKITALTAGRKSAAAAGQETGRRLAAFAESVGLTFTFAQCRVDRDGSFRPAALKMLKGEAVVFNCAVHGPHQKHHSSVSIKSFLAGAAEVGARVVTVAEEEGGGCAGKGGFLGRFLEEMQRYSAMWDALEAGFPKQGRAREMVERMVLGPRIAAAVEAVFQRRGEEDDTRLSEWMPAVGFRRVGLSFFNQWQAKLLLGLFNDGYRVELEAANKIVLNWKSRRLVSASVWSAPLSPAIAEA